MSGKLTLHQYYERTYLLMIALLAGLIWMAETVPVWLWGVLFTLLLLQFRLSGWRGQLPALIRALVLGGTVVAAFALYQTHRDIALLFSPVLVALLVFFLGARHTRRGYWITIVVIVVTGLVNLLAGDTLGSYLFFIALASSLVLSLNAAHLYFYVGVHEAEFRRIPKRYFLPFLSSVGLGLMVGGALFVFFPRALQWQNPLGMRQKSTTTGYSGTVALGASSISESQTVAMLIEASDPQWLYARAPFLLMRGNTLERFDGVNWKTAGDSWKRPLDSLSQLQTTNSFERRFLRLKIYRETHSAQAVFLTGVVHDASFPRAITGPLRIDSNGSLYRSRLGETRYSYLLTLSPTRRPTTLDELTLKQLRQKLRRHRALGFSFSDDAADFRRFLTVPPSIDQAAYFQAWQNEVLGEGFEDRSVGQVFLKLAGHFKQSFEVGFDSASHNVDSLEAFLTTGRYGHCEYFATAGVLFLRRLGIPARIALGYRGGNFNEVSRVLEVRESNAHAWVEAYIPGSGWLSFDPTPIVVRPPMSSWQAAFGLYAAAIKFWAQRYIVDYNSQTQARLYQSLRQSPALARRVSSERRHWRWLWLTAAVGLVAWGGRSVFKALKRRGRRPSLPHYYVRFARRVRRKGYVRAKGETFRQFHARLAQDPMFAVDAEQIGAAIERDLYGT